MYVYTVAKIYNDTTQIRLINTKAKSFIIFYDNYVFIDTKLATFWTQEADFPLKSRNNATEIMLLYHITKRYAK